MKYVLLMYADPDHTRAMTDDELAAIARKHEELRNDLTDSGELLNGAGLVFPEETVLVRVDAHSNGPLAGDVTEHLTAYYVVECDTAERARSLGERLLDHHVTAVEVRAIHDTAGM